MYDSHCHLDDDRYDADRALVLERARAAGVRGIMVPGYAPDAWAGLATLCASDPLLSCAVGLHPWYVHTLAAEARDDAMNALANTARTVKARAIGECGLDGGMAKRDGADMDTQVAVLHAQLEVAEQLELPVILHCVGAHARMLEVLSQHELSRGGVMHSYSGSHELVRDYLRHGMSFSFAGILTRDNARRPKRALQAVPLERLMVESDGPDQAAQDVAPARSEPAHIARVLAAMAEVRAVSHRELAEITERNARVLFGLLP